jgi:hypothetical protein
MARLSHPTTKTSPHPSDLEGRALDPAPCQRPVGIAATGHGDSGYIMRPGDALQLDGERTHGPQTLVQLPIRFLSVVAYGEVHEAD